MLSSDVVIRCSYLQVGHVDCSKEVEICRRVHIRKFPMVALFKIHGYYEWHHGN